MALASLGATHISFCLIKCFRFTGPLYLILGAFGLIVSFKELWVWLPLFAWLEFWLGVILYFLQFLVVMRKKPNLLSDATGKPIFGYWELQHFILLWPTTLHSLVVLQNL